MSLTEPNKERLLAAFRRQKLDRVANFESIIESPTLQHVLGDDVPLRLPPTMTQAEKAHRRLPLCMDRGEPCWRPTNNLLVGAEQYVELCVRTGIDAVCPFLTWAGTWGSDDWGRVADWHDLDKIRPAPTLDALLAHLHDYFRAVDGTALGVGVMCRSVMCNAYQLMGFENFMLKMYDDRRLIEHVLDMFLEYGIMVTEAVAQTPVDFFFLDDDIAGGTGTFVSPSWLKEMWMPRTERMLAPLKGKGIPIIYHCCGNLSQVIPMAITMGIQAIHPVQPTCNDIYELKKHYGEWIAFIGNMDIAGALAFGTEDEVVAETKQHIDRLSYDGGYVVASSHSITRAVKPQNFLAMVETARTYGVYG